MACAKPLEGLLEYYEDPVAGKAEMAMLAKQTSLPLATNMCCVSFADLPATIQLGSVQIILGDHHFWGGLRASVQLARICQTWKIGLSMHSNSHLGISLAAMTHLAAAVPNLTYACDTHYPWQAEEIKSRLDAHKLKLVLHNLPAGNWDAGRRHGPARPRRVATRTTGATGPSACATPSANTSIPPATACRSCTKR